MTFQLAWRTRIALLMVPVWPEFGLGAGRLAAAPLADRECGAGDADATGLCSAPHSSGMSAARPGLGGRHEQVW